MEFTHENDNRSLINVNAGNSSWQYRFLSVVSLRDRGHFVLKLYLFLNSVPGTNIIKKTDERENIILKTAIKYFETRQFQRVGRWRGSKQYFTVGFKLSITSYTNVRHK